MTQVTVATSEGRFTADADGPTRGPLVLLLHGYPQIGPGCWKTARAGSGPG